MNLPPIKTVDYAYDALDQLIERVVDPDGDTGNTPIEKTFYVYDQGQVVLEFDDQTGSYYVDAGDLSHRYLWNPAGHANVTVTSGYLHAAVDDEGMFGSLFS